MWPKERKQDRVSSGAKQADSIRPIDRVPVPIAADHGAVSSCGQHLSTNSPQLSAGVGFSMLAAAASSVGVRPSEVARPAPAARHADLFCLAPRAWILFFLFWIGGEPNIDRSAVASPLSGFVVMELDGGCARGFGRGGPSLEMMMGARPCMMLIEARGQAQQSTSINATIDTITPASRKGPIQPNCDRASTLLSAC